MRTHSLWALLAVFVLGGGLGAVTTNLAPFFIEQEGMPPTSWLGILWVHGLGHRCADNVGVPRRTALRALLPVHRLPGPWPRNHFAGHVPYPWNMASFMVLCGMVGGAFGILQPVIFGNYFGRRSFASIQGGMRPFVAVPGLTLPLLVSYLFDIQGSFNLGFTIAGIITGLGVVAALFAVAPCPKPPPVASGMG